MKSTVLTNVLLILILGCLLFLCVMSRRPVLIHEPVAIEGYDIIPHPASTIPVQVQIVR